MKRSRIRSAVIVAAVATLASGAAAKPSPPNDSHAVYYVQGGAPACRRIGDLQKAPTLWRATPTVHTADYAKINCVWLPSNARVAWSGKRIEFYFARITTTDRRTLVVYANDLAQLPYRDPLRRDYVTVEGAIACAAPFRLAEASQAVADGDRGWLVQTGCIRLPAGVRATRIAPATATESDVWQVRLRDRSAGATVWMRGTDMDAHDGPGNHQ